MTSSAPEHEKDAACSGQRKAEHSRRLNLLAVPLHQRWKLRCRADARTNASQPNGRRPPSTHQLHLHRSPLWCNEPSAPDDDGPRDPTPGRRLPYKIMCPAACPSTAYAKKPQHRAYWETRIARYPPMEHKTLPSRCGIHPQRRVGNQAYRMRRPRAARRNCRVAWHIQVHTSSNSDSRMMPPAARPSETSSFASRSPPTRLSSMAYSEAAKRKVHGGLGEVIPA